MKTSIPGSSIPAPDDLKSEMDTAFAMIQSAIGQHAFGDREATVMAAECVKRIAARVREALADPKRGDAEKHLLEAKLRALMEAAGRIPRG